MRLCSPGTTLTQVNAVKTIAPLRGTWNQYRTGQEGSLMISGTCLNTWTLYEDNKAGLKCVLHIEFCYFKKVLYECQLFFVFVRGGGEDEEKKKKKTNLIWNSAGTVISVQYYNKKALTLLMMVVSC